MSKFDHNRLPEDLADVAELLREHRPEATALELDGVKRRILSRKAAPARGSAQRSQSMKSRIAMMAMLVVGLLMSGTGAGLAVSGLSSDSNPGVAQYGTTDTIPTLPCDANGDGVVTEDEDMNGPGVPGCLDDGDVLPTTDEEPTGKPLGEPEEDSPQNDPQPTRQVEAGADTGELPFTGLAALPILIGGVALLGGGLVLRRRTGDES